MDTMVKQNNFQKILNMKGAIRSVKLFYKLNLLN